MQEVIFDQFIIEKLSDSLDIEHIGNFHTQKIKIDELYKLDENDISPRIMKKLIKIAILEDRLTSGEQRLDLKLTVYKSKAMVEKIVANMTLSESEYIYLSDVRRFMEEDEAHKAFNLFGGIKGRQRITKSDLENWVIHSFEKRRFLSLTLKDAESIAMKLHLVVNVLVIAIIFAIGLLFIGITSIHSLIAVISTLALGAFIFGNTAKMIFESIVFFFVHHAFDVGDLCVVDGVEWIFKKSFVRYDNLKIMIPNGALTTKYIINKSQSQDVKEILTFLIPPSTSSETIYRIMERIKGHIKNKDHHWRPDPMVSMKAMNDFLQLKLEVQLTHVTNYQQMDVMVERTSEIFVPILKILKEFGINV